MSSEFGQYDYIHEDKGELEQLDISGSGRFEFYRVRIFGRLHFVKRLKSNYLADLQSRDALLKEFRVGYILDHPGIVRYLRYEDTAIYEEYVDGHTLQQHIDSGDHSLKSARDLTRICRELLEAIGHMHSHGVLHLDLKPDNIMLTRVGNHVKIIDLGCCISPSCNATPGFTRENMAPEQGTGEWLVASTDIYLVGKIMESLSAAAGCPRRWRKFISKATAAEISDRFRSTDEAIDAIPKEKSHTGLKTAVAALCMLAVIAAAAGAGWHMSESEKAVSETAPVPKDTVIKIIKEIVPDSGRMAHDQSYGNMTVNQTVSAPVPPEEKFRKQLKKHIFDFYRRNVKPVCKRPTSEFQSEGKFHEEEIQKAMRIAIDDAKAYGNKLMKQNPGHEDDIEAELYSVINEAQTMCSAWLPWQ